MDHKRILVVVNDEEAGDLVDTTLTLDGYTIIRTTDAIRGFQLAQLHKPDLIILDLDMPRTDGLMLSRHLRQEKELHSIPIVMLTGYQTHPEDRIAGLKLGADDYLQKPLLPQELSIKVSRLLIRTEEHLETSPLTKLPGSYPLETEIARRIQDNRIFALCYFDIDNFKPFNDHYGYQQGDRVIQLLATLISDASRQAGTDGDFLAHIGGDDFILLTVPERVKPVCEQVIREFTKIVPGYYSETDHAQGFITILNRKGERQQFPIMSLSIAVASNENHEIRYYAQLIDILNEMKSYAKTQPGSTWIKDRRQDIVTQAR